VDAELPQRVLLDRVPLDRVLLGGVGPHRVGEGTGQGPPGARAPAARPLVRPAEALLRSRAGQPQPCDIVPGVTCVPVTPPPADPTTARPHGALGPRRPLRPAGQGGPAGTAGNTAPPETVVESHPSRTRSHPLSARPTDPPGHSPRPSRQEPLDHGTRRDGVR
jgi:hypothetical protein